MKKKYIVVITVCIISTITLSILGFTLISPEIFSNSKEGKQAKIPEVIIITDPSMGNAPLEVSFKSLLQNFGDDVTYSWDFGDGKASNEKNPNHVYSQEDTYNCTLTVNDKESETSDAVMITVLENNPPIIKIIVDKTSGNLPLTVQFDSDGFDTDGEIVSYEWEILYPPLFSYQKISNHNEKNFSEKFIRRGLYEVKLIVIDDYGNIATDYIKIQVIGHKIQLMYWNLLSIINSVNASKKIFATLYNIYQIIFPSQTHTIPERIISFFEVK